MSRRHGLDGLEITAVNVYSAGKPATTADVGFEFSVEIEATARTKGTSSAQFVVLLFTEDGGPLGRNLSRCEVVTLDVRERTDATPCYKKVLLGSGREVLPVTIFRDGVPRDRSKTAWYDPLSRSFQFEVIACEPGDPSLFHHPAEWKMSSPGRASA